MHFFLHWRRKEREREGGRVHKKAEEGGKEGKEGRELFVCNVQGSR